MTKTLHELKDEIARENGSESWYDFNVYTRASDEMFLEVFNRFQKVDHDMIDALIYDRDSWKEAAMREREVVEEMQLYVSTLKKRIEELEAALKIISNDYMSSDELRVKSEKMYGIDYEEAIGMAYDNIQELAKQSILHPSTNGKQD